MPTDEEFLAYNRGVIDEFRANAGVVPQPDFPVLLLTTTGARTGRPATTPLGFGVDDGRVFVVASKGGGPSHPAWFRNLCACPDVTVELGATSYAARAVVVDGDERNRLYGIISARIPAFAEYEGQTTRVFPVIVLDGVPAP
jgi:deazaflavin-dependent oxidoreductase (nitroreductase family)